MKTKKKVFTKNLKSFCPKNQVKTKKRSFPKIEEFLSPKASEDQKKIQKSTSAFDADHSQIIGGMQSNYWGDAVKLLGDISPPGFGTLANENSTIFPRKIMRDFRTSFFSPAFSSLYFEGYCSFCICLAVHILNWEDTEKISIKALIKSTVTAITVLNCIRNLHSQRSV